MTIFFVLYKQEGCINKACRLLGEIDLHIGVAERQCLPV